MRLLTGDAFTGLFHDFQRSAFRLETRERYGVPSEQAAFQAFLAGEDPDLSWFGSWLDLVRSQTGRGRRIERVRIVDTPPTDYQRFELYATPLNLAAGEDIRYLPREAARRLGLPEHDFWLFDAQTIAYLHFDSGDRLLGAELSQDPDRLAEHLSAQRTAWTHAISYAAYAAG